MSSDFFGSREQISVPCRKKDSRGQDDLAILRRAYQENRVILTHDSDFGTLAVMQGEPFTGIVYLRPGHIRGEFVIQIIKAMSFQTIEVQPPFIVVAAFSRGNLQTRVRQFRINAVKTNSISDGKIRNKED